MSKHGILSRSFVGLSSLATSVSADSKHRHAGVEDCSATDRASDNHSTGRSPAGRCISVGCSAHGQTIRISNSVAAGGSCDGWNKKLENEPKEEPCMCVINENLLSVLFVSGKVVSRRVASWPLLVEYRLLVGSRRAN